MRHVFIDADVILDLILQRQPFFTDAARLFTRIQEGELTGSVSSLIFSNLFYVLRRLLSKEQALEALRRLRLLVGVLPVDSDIVDRALASSFTDFEDAIQYYAATAGNMDAIITRNKRDYRLAQLPVFTAGEWFQRAENSD